MASEIRVNQIQNRSGLSTVTFSDTGVVISGITTITDLRTSGTTTVAAGSTSAPSITPTGDSNTGIFFPSADTIAFAEGGVEALRIDSSSNIGIGTSTPSQKMHLYQPLTNSQCYLHIQNNRARNAAVKYETTQGAWLTGTGIGADQNRFSIYEDGVGDRVIVTSAGNVNIVNGNLVFSTSGKGIDFSATADSSGTMTSELLADYEEGSWTPTLIASSQANVYSSGTRYGYYTKVGRIVTATAVFDNATCVAGNAVVVGGLPYTITSTTTRYPAFNSHTVGSAISGTTIQGGYARPGETNFQLIQQNSFNTVNFSNGDFYMFLTIIYAV